MAWFDGKCRGNVPAGTWTLVFNHHITEGDEMKHRRSLIAVLAMVMLLMPALSLRASQANAQDGDRETLRFGVNAQDLATLDPHLASGTQDRTVVDMVFNGLIRFKPGDASVFEPDLATAIPEPVDEAGTQTWTFTLRTDAMCHPTASSEAYPLTSADVVFSLQKSATAETSGSAGEYTGMTFEAVDPATVKVTVDSPAIADALPAQVRQLPGRLHRLPAGVRGARRRWIQDQSGRHRPVHVQRLHPADQP